MKFFILLGCIFILGMRAEACPPGHYSVKGHPRSGYTRSDGVEVSATVVTTYCKELTKAAEYIRVRFKKGVPQGWPHKAEKPKDWIEAEKERLIEALENLPEVLLNEKIEGIYRFQKSKDYPNPATSAQNIIVFYDTSFDSSHNLGRILAHELLHQNFSGLDKNSQQDYRRVTGWHLELDSNRKIYWVGREKGYVEEDGKNSFEEDYANNLEYYLFDSDKLKKVTPTAYEWIRKTFGKGFELKGKRK